MKPWIVCTLALLVAIQVAPAMNLRKPAASPKAASIPVIYCTDLFHPHDDPDDHFDVATMFAMPELDLKCVILDQGGRQLRKSGSIPVSQLNHITSRSVPTAIGLENKLVSPTDKALDQKLEFQQGVEMILATLRNSKRPVMIAAVGSMRDLTAAYNRDPKLFHRRVGKVLIFIGEASNPDFVEHNVRLDPQAYIGLMRSGLPIYWAPCFDGGSHKNNGHASFWHASHEDLLLHAQLELIQFFIYALEKEHSDPLAFLTMPVDPQRKAQLFSGRRNLWCTAIFGALSDRKVMFDGTEYVSALSGSGAARSKAGATELFGFSPVDLSITDAGVVQYGKSKESKKVMRFEVRDKARYAEGMTAVTADLLASVGAKQ